MLAVVDDASQSVVRYCPVFWPRLGMGVSQAGKSGTAAAASFEYGCKTNIL